MPKEQAHAWPPSAPTVSAGTLSRLWQMLLKAHDEVRRAPDAGGGRRDGPDPPGLRRRPAGSRRGAEGAAGRRTPVGGGGAAAAGAAGLHRRRRRRRRGHARRRPSAAAPAAQAMPVLRSFEDVMALIERKRDIGLRSIVERYVRPVSFRPGAIEFEAAPGAPNNLPGAWSGG
jgi:DNA polymerase-3 subunit gamma/tau